MTELAEIAAAVSRALGLELIDKEPRAIVPIASNWIWSDGSDVFSDPWFRLALEWLWQRGDLELFREEPEMGARSQYYHLYPGTSSKKRISLICPLAEFPARAIHALEREER